MDGRLASFTAFSLAAFAGSAPILTHACWLLFLLCGGPVVCLAQPDVAPAITVPRVSIPPKLSDFLTNKPRQAELGVADFRQFDPNEGQPVSRPTSAFLSYDDKNLYVAFIAKDDPKLIRARLAKRKQIPSDDRVIVEIDASHDHRNAYFFGANPYGVQRDGITTDGYGDDLSWEGVWSSEAKVTGDGYVVLLTIPFKTLRFPDAPKQKWGILLVRRIARNSEMSVWPALSRSRSQQWVAQFGHLEGLENISPGRNIRFIPYGLFSESRYLDRPAGAPWQPVRERDLRGGVDAKVVIKDALTLDATLNPDFSQVESDEPQTTVNQRYEVYYPEQRPFFMENASYFNTPVTLFFSRRIVDPEYGLRLTGKLGRWGIGVMAADDRAPGVRAAPDDPLHGRRAGNAVVSLQRDLLHDSHVRFFATDRELSSSFNRVFSLDTRWNLKRSFFFTAQAVTSRTRSLDGREYGGNAYYAQLSRSNRKVQYYSAYTDISPSFRADLGYIQRTDIRRLTNRLGYTRWRENKTLISFGPAVTVLGNWNRRGQTQDWEVNFEWNMQFTRMTYLTVSRSQAFELYRGQGFRKGNNTYYLSSEWLKWLAVSGSYTHGGSVNYYPAAGNAPLLGDGRRSNLSLTLRPTPRLRLDHTYIYSYLRARPGCQAEPAPATSVYHNHILRWKANYQYTRALSFRAIVDYNGVLPNTSLVALDRSKRLGYDLLLSYLLHPGTAFYVGYTDTYENLQQDPSRLPYLKQSGFPDVNTGRQFFVKLSYLVRF